MTACLAWISGLDESDRRAIGDRAAQVVGEWGPERFASGTLEALNLARTRLGQLQRTRTSAPSGARS